MSASFLWLLLVALRVDAHPVAQGQLDVRVSKDALEITARVSNEQILIAGTLSPTAHVPQSGNDTLEALWQEHGTYLLSHLKIRADQQRLMGRLLGVKPSGADFVELSLLYPLNAYPKQLQLQQDVLNEVEYVPGNPWEATYVVRLQARQDTFLLASKDRELTLDVGGADAVEGDRGFLAFAGQFVVDGIRHILTGYDHLLFVTALVLSVVRLRSLVAVIFAFTLAHSLTLTLSVLDIVRLPSKIVEPLIAASIVAASLANLVWPAGERAKARWGMAFFFGLFHGLGFAGGLLDATVDLAGKTVAVAIASFSIGVECGHMLVVVPAFLLCRWLSRLELRDARLESGALVLRAGSAVVLAGGVFYLINATLLQAV